MSATPIAADHSEEFEQLAGLSALRVLDGDDQVRFERHAAQCERCRLIVRSDRETLGNLSLAAPEMEPSPDFKRRLMDRAAAELAGLAPGGQAATGQGPAAEAPNAQDAGSRAAQAATGLGAAGQGAAGGVPADAASADISSIETAPSTPPRPADAEPEPEHAAPVQPEAGDPAQTQHGDAGPQPERGTPVQPEAGTPAQTEHGDAAPVQPEAGTPAQTEHAAPVQPEAGAPGQTYDGDAGTEPELGGSVRPMAEAETAGEPIPIRARPGNVVPFWRRQMWATSIAALLVLGLFSYAGYTAFMNQVVATYTTGAGPASMTVVVHRSGQTELQMQGVADPPPGFVYEAWVIPPGKQPVAAGVTPSGEATLPLPSGVQGSTIAVTLERGPGGASAPTTPPLMAVVVA